MNRKVCYQLKHLDVLRKRVNFLYSVTRRILTSISKHVNHSQHALLYGACIIFFEGGRGEKFPKSVPAQLTGNRREEFEQVFCTNQVLFLMLNNSCNKLLPTKQSCITTKLPSPQPLQKNEIPSAVLISIHQPLLKVAKTWDPLALHQIRLHGYRCPAVALNDERIKDANAAITLVEKWPEKIQAVDGIRTHFTIS